ncbi:CdaR family protein [Desulfohalovibrio reitneri]|uniref:CdaR family protein n=1 Tax=Desulfohalovibrio reitneri TaxID=1307759 RepID=UPI0004A771F2|nr:CdaR family protein [Desulfohalovibrio reitneri]
MRENWQYALLALVLAVFSWYLVSGRERVETWVQAPVVTSNTPSDMVIMDGLVGKVEVRVRGPSALIRNLAAADMAYTLDLSGLEPGENVINLDPGQFPLSGAVRALEIKPPRLTVRADRVVSREMAVRPEWKGELDASWRFRRAETDPPTVQVIGPEGYLDGLEAVPTRPVDLPSPRPEEVTREVALDLPPTVEAEPSGVLASLFFGPELLDIWVKMPVGLPDSAKRGYRFDPGEVRLHLEVPRYLTVDAGFREGIEVRAAPLNGLPPEGGMVGLDVTLPKFYNLLEAKPDEVRAVPDGDERADREN